MYLIGFKHSCIFLNYMLIVAVISNLGMFEEYYSREICEVHKICNVLNRPKV